MGCCGVAFLYLLFSMNIVRWVLQNMHAVRCAGRNCFFSMPHACLHLCRLPSTRRRLFLEDKHLFPSTHFLPSAACWDTCTFPCLLPSLHACIQTFRRGDWGMAAGAGFRARQTGCVDGGLYIPLPPYAPPARMFLYRLPFPRTKTPPHHTATASAALLRAYICRICLGRAAGDLERCRLA